MTTRTHAATTYADHLAARDGEVNEARRTLSAREEFFGRIDAEPVRSARSFDPDVFLTSLRRRRVEHGQGRELCWLVATAKLNQSERFGMALGDAYGAVTVDDDDPERIHIALQEIYHTRILADIVAMFGLPTPPVPPPFMIRQFVKATIFMPESRMFPLVGAGEMAGCVLFELMRDTGCEIFGDERDVAARIRSLYDEILVDEIGHVGYCASRMGRTGRALTHKLFPHVGRMFMRQIPELAVVLDMSEVERRFTTRFDLDTYLARFDGAAVTPARI